MPSLSSKDLAIHLSIGGLVTFIVSWLDIRPLGILFLGVLALWSYSVLCPCSLTLENAKPVQEMVRGNLETFAKLRRDKPAVFCFIVSVALLLLMVLGHIVSGTWLVIGGLSVIGYVASRNSIRIVKAPPQAERGSKLTSDTPSWTGPIIPGPPAQPASNAAACTKEASPVGSPASEVDEFLPEVNESAMQVLNLAGDEAVLFSAKATGANNGGDSDDDDSLPMDMLMPDESLPDIERDQLTDDNVSEDEFKLHPVRAAAAVPAVAAARKGKSSSKTHAARSGGSGPVIITTSDEEDDAEDEEGLARGLNFDDDDFSHVDAASQQPLVASYHSHRGRAAQVTDFVSHMIPASWNKVGNLIAGGDNQMSRSESAAVSRGKRAPHATTKKSPSFESSDDSEFELLNADDVDDEVRGLSKSSS